MAEDSCSAFVLHARPWRESSLLLDVFSRERGLMQVSARGVQGKSRRTWPALLQLFTPLKMRLQSRRDWPLLLDVESIQPQFDLQQDYVLAGIYCNELLMRLLVMDDAQEHLFDHYVHCLQQLAAQTLMPAVLRQFEWSLLQELGYACDLQHDCDSDVIEARQFYRLHEHALMPVAQPNERDFAGHDLLAMQQGNWQQSPQVAKRMMQMLLRPHLGDKPLNSRELWRQKTQLRAFLEE